MNRRKKKKPKKSRRWIQKALKVRPRRLGKGRHHRKSVRVEAAKKGSLHRYLGVPLGEKIPVLLLRNEKVRLQKLLKRVPKPSIVHFNVLMRLQQVNFALTARKFKHKKRK